MESSRVLIDAAVLLVTVIGMIITGVWAIGKVREDLKDNDSEIVKAMNEEFLVIRREFGETVTAMRAKMTEIEFYIRDHYVTRETFDTVLNRLLAEIRTLGERMETNKISLENKIDRIKYPVIEGD